MSSARYVGQISNLPYVRAVWDKLEICPTTARGVGQIGNLSYDGAWCGTNWKFVLRRRVVWDKLEICPTTARGVGQIENLSYGGAVTVIVK
jgi:hypothetical protein